LATYSQSATEAEMRAVMAQLWKIEKAARVEVWLA
jgi:predicted metal-dependent peptidase